MIYKSERAFRSSSLPVYSRTNRPPCVVETTSAESESDDGKTRSVAGL